MEERKEDSEIQRTILCLSDSPQVFPKQGKRKGEELTPQGKRKVVSGRRAHKSKIS